MKLKITLALVAILVVIQASRIAHDSGLFTEINTVDWGQCERLTGPVGAEDLTIDYHNRVAYIGADDRRAYLTHGDQESLENGGLWLLDLKVDNGQPKPIPVSIDGPFHPHGIALRNGNNGPEELYVINHITPHHHSIEVFTILAPGELKLKRRISFPEMISPNDLVVVAEDQFFMSNDHGNPRHSLMEMAEDYLGLPLSNVVYFDGQQAHVAVSGLRMANGVQLSTDQQSLYIAETTGRRITKFSRGESIKDWHKHSSVDVDSGVDNLEWDAQGRLLTGSHPKLFDFLAHMNDGDAHSPSEAIRINVSSEPMTYETIYMESGDRMSGSSVAAVIDNTLLMGPVFEPHFIRCVK